MWFVEKTEPYKKSHCFELTNVDSRRQALPIVDLVWCKKKKEGVKERSNKQTIANIFLILL